METATIYLSLGVVILIWIYKIVTSRSEESLETLGFSHEKPMPIVGNILSLIVGKESGVQLFDRLYKKFSSQR